MDYKNIKNKEEYAGQFVAFCPKTAKVFAFGKCLGDSIDDEGEVRLGVISCAEEENEDYRIHFFKKRKAPQL